MAAIKKARAGKIEKQYPVAFATIEKRMFAAWNASQGEHSRKFYDMQNLSLTRFLFDYFYKTKLVAYHEKRDDDNYVFIGDCNDDHLATALAKIWDNYLNPNYFLEK